MIYYLKYLFAITVVQGLIDENGHPDINAEPIGNVSVKVWVVPDGHQKSDE